MNLSWSRFDFLFDVSNDRFACRDMIELQVSFDDMSFLFLRVVVEVKLIDEPVLQRTCYRFHFRCRSDEGERIDRYPDISSFRHHHIDDEIFHGDIEDFLDIWLKSMDLIDEENISVFDIVEDRNQF